MDVARLTDLLHAYRNAPTEFQATSYWTSYEREILDCIPSLNVTELQSGKHPILAKFGFGDVVYYYHPRSPLLRRTALKCIHRYVIKDRTILPYQLGIQDIREMAYHHCELEGTLSSAKPIRAIEMATVGSPVDVFQVGGRKYSVRFLNYYLRYCFAQRHISFKGHEIVVELGTGSGTQVEVLKKLYPSLTILCFDLPAQIFLCEAYLSEALGRENVVGTEATLRWGDLSHLKKGSVHCFGNWQIPLLRDLDIDVFWNAASFGEMEPDVVGNYLSFVKGKAEWIYLLQARHGKETRGRTHVKEPVTLDDYGRLLSGYVLREEDDAYCAHRRLSESGGYFQGVWQRR